MKKFIYLIILCFIFNHSNAATMNGSELKERISKWLKTKGVNTQVEILDNIKYPYCNEKDLLISDISGSYRLIKVNCIGEDKWSFIVRNKQNVESNKNKSKNKVNVLALKNSLKSGTIINENDIIVILGKGREEYQEVKGEKLFHSDYKIINEYL